MRSGAVRIRRLIFGTVDPVELDRLDHLGTGHEYCAGRCQKQHFSTPSGILDHIMLSPGHRAGGEGIGDEKGLELGFDYEQPFELFPHDSTVASVMPSAENRYFPEKNMVNCKLTRQLQQFSDPARKVGKYPAAGFWPREWKRSGPDRKAGRDRSILANIRLPSWQFRPASVWLP